MGEGFPLARNNHPSGISKRGPLMQGSVDDRRFNLYKRSTWYDSIIKYQNLCLTDKTNLFRFRHFVEGYKRSCNTFVHNLEGKIE